MSQFESEKVIVCATPPPMKQFLLLSSVAVAAAIELHAADFQPLAAHSRRVLEALETLGEPLPAKDQSAVRELLLSGASDAAAKLEAIFDPHCLFFVEISPEIRVKVARGPTTAELVDGSWRAFLIKVRNDAGTTAALRVTSPQAQKVFGGTPRKPA